ncbi:MAG TPA: glycosyltransferase family 39 protein [Pirellulales bacterium]|nr:glycosyltransferase family 39 protein [Pirellulales bacterium]
MVPPDVGALTQAAERVHSGELPHLNYDSLYSGALSKLSALSFDLFGNNFAALQKQLFAFSLLFVLAVYGIARHAVGPLTAGLVTLLCVVWSLPNYFIGMPSWYNLFFATFGTLMLLRHIRDGRRRWLVAAGLCAGCSIIIKIIGLYFVAAALLYLVYREQVADHARHGLDHPQRRRRAARQRTAHRFDWPASVATIACVIAFITCLAVLVMYRPAPAEILHFALPGAVLATLLIVHESRLSDSGGAQRLKNILAAVSFFSAGAAIPMAAFVLPYISHAGLRELWHGMISSSARLSEESTIVPLPATTVWFFVIPLVSIALIARLARRTIHGKLLLIAAVAILSAFVALGWVGPVYRSAWHSTRALVPLLAVGTFALLNSRGLTRQLDDDRRQQLFLLSAVAAMVSLVQVPFAHAIYFLYTAPMVFLAALFYSAAQRGVSRRLFQAAAVALGLFAAVWLNGAFSPDYGRRYASYESRPLQIDRCRSFRMDRASATQYETLISAIQQHSQPGSYIYAAPDCPEIYFFANRKNPTRTLYDFLDADFHSDDRDARILKQLKEHGVDVVVLNFQMPVSGLVTPQFEAELARRYPNAILFVSPRSRTLQTVLRWREKPGQPQQAAALPRQSALQLVAHATEAGANLRTHGGAE